MNAVFGQHGTVLRGDSVDLFESFIEESSSLTEIVSCFSRNPKGHSKLTADRSCVVVARGHL